MKIFFQWKLRKDFSFEQLLKTGPLNILSVSNPRFDDFHYFHNFSLKTPKNTKLLPQHLSCSVVGRLSRSDSPFLSVILFVRVSREAASGQPQLVSCFQRELDNHTIEDASRNFFMVGATPYRQRITFSLNMIISFYITDLTQRSIINDNRASGATRNYGFLRRRSQSAFILERQFI